MSNSFAAILSFNQQKNIIFSLPFHLQNNILCKVMIPYKSKKESFQSGKISFIQRYNSN